MEIDEQVSSLYKLAKKYPDNAELQEAIEVIKFLRRSQGSLKQWNQRYRNDNSDLTTEVSVLSQNIEDLHGKLHDLNSELEALKMEIVDLSTERKKMLVERERAIAELRSIELEVKRAAHNVRATKSIFGKFTILWTLLRSLFLDDGWEDFGEIDNRLPTSPDKPQMGSGQAAINKSLLDK